MTSELELKLTGKVRLPLGLLHAQYNLVSALVCLLLCRQQWTVWFSLLTLSYDFTHVSAINSPFSCPQGLQLVHTSSQVQHSTVRQAQNWQQTETVAPVFSWCWSWIYFLTYFWKSLCFSNSHWIICLNSALLGLLLIKFTQDDVIWFKIL